MKSSLQRHQQVTGASHSAHEQLNMWSIKVQNEPTLSEKAKRFVSPANRTPMWCWICVLPSAPTTNWAREAKVSVLPIIGIVIAPGMRHGVAPAIPRSAGGAMWQRLIMRDAACHPRFHHARKSGKTPKSSVVQPFACRTMSRLSAAEMTAVLLERSART